MTEDQEEELLEFETPEEVRNHYQEDMDPQERREIILKNQRVLESLMGRESSIDASSVQEIFTQDEVLDILESQAFLGNAIGQVYQERNEALERLQYLEQPLWKRTWNKMTGWFQ